MSTSFSLHLASLLHFFVITVIHYSSSSVEGFKIVVHQRDRYIIDEQKQQQQQQLNLLPTPPTVLFQQVQVDDDDIGNQPRLFYTTIVDNGGVPKVSKDVEEEKFQCGISSWDPPPPSILLRRRSLSATAEAAWPTDHQSYKIRRGQPVTDPRSLPWMAEVLWRGKVPICAATIIHERFVLTASHCLWWSYPNASSWWPRFDQWEETETGNYTVVAGTVQLNGTAKEVGVRRVSRRVIPHPNFRWMWHLMADDVALIELAEPLPLSDRVRPICLSSLKVTAASEEGLRKGAVIAGWGKPSIHDHMESLHAARLDVAPVDYCSDWPMFNATTQICLRGNGSSACGGDSGGPLLIRRLIKGGSGGGGWRWEQIGVANSGNEGCTTPNIYARVCSHCAWIADRTKGAATCLKGHNHQRTSSGLAGRD